MDFASKVTGSILDDTLYHIRIECRPSRRKIIPNRSLNKRKILLRLDPRILRSLFFISSMVFFFFLRNARVTLELLSAGRSRDPFV